MKYARDWRFVVPSVVALVFLNILVYRVVLVPSSMSVRILEGGETLLEMPDGYTVLINAGPDASVLRTLGAALPFWRRRIDALILTSPTAHTAGGISEMTERYRVGSLLRSSATGSQSLEVALEKTGIATRVLTRGDRIALGREGYVDVLWPPKTQKPLGAADGALILRVAYGSTSFLIENDLSPRVERILGAKETASDLTISSSTSPGRFVSDGATVRVAK